MATWLKQSTEVTITLGPFKSVDDFTTAQSALSIAQSDIRLSKNGGAYAQSGNPLGGTHRENGQYAVTLSTADTDTLGSLRVEVHKAGSLSVWREFMVVPENVWDSLFGPEKLSVDAAEIVEAIAQLSIDGKTLRQVMRGLAAIFMGEIANAGEDIETFPGLNGTTRVQVAYDDSGNRIVTLTLGSP